jgi:hypothetical protein
MQGRCGGPPEGRRSARVLTLLAACLLVLACCARGKPAAVPSAKPPARDAADPRAAWYQLRDGTFQPISGLGEAARTALLPWTVQSRVADLALGGGQLYLALNGSGLARMGGGDAGPRFAYFPDRLIFAHRTITALVPRAGSMVVHVYYNALLNTVAADALPLQGVSLVSFLPDRDDYAFLVPPFQRKNRAWEAVGFAAVSPDEFILEWKLSEPGETRFAHTRFFPGAKTEAACTRDAYVAAVAAPVESLPARSERRKLLDACAAEARQGAPQASVLFTVRAAGRPLRQSYRAAPPSAEGPDPGLVLSVEVFEDGPSGWALLPGGRLLAIRQGRAAAVVHLPALPAGTTFTDLVKAGSLLVLPWEEKSFTDVGAAGILLYSIDG